ncbi:hypothetical protein Taro_013681 [Colocasia esculenta]|uniref:G domain-containing protein n=1 Tax=Colocasia esculenta TaxID=4460 RepID=A0A843UG64_COLES|nr:hypothetical protein [Colocasia esculenta]
MVLPAESAGLPRLAESGGLLPDLRIGSSLSVGSELALFKLVFLKGKGRLWASNELNGLSYWMLSMRDVCVERRERMQLIDERFGEKRSISSVTESFVLFSAGKTQCINHFRINDSWYLVDLPGYGYASAPQELRTDWDKFTKDYFLNRQTLVSVFLLIDASIPAKKKDLEYASWLGQNKIPMTLIFTKCDKRKKRKNGGKRSEENVGEFQSLISEFFETALPWIMTSSVTNQGRDEILLHMAQLRNYWLKH